MRGFLFLSVFLLMFSLQGFASPQSDLFAAAEQGNAAAIQAALEAGADVNAYGYFGRTALMEAAWKGHTEAMQILINAGADLNATDMMCSTALNYAAGEGHLEAVQILIKADADINYQSDGETFTALISAAREGHADVVRALLDAGAQLELNRYGKTALIYASEKNGVDPLEVVQILIEAGADVNARDDKYGGTALMRAAGAGQREIAMYLLEAGADANAKDEDGRTALMYAKENEHYDIVELIYEAGGRSIIKDGN